MIILCVDIDPSQTLDINKVVVDLTTQFSAVVTSEDSHQSKRDRAREKMQELSDKVEELVGETPGQDHALASMAAQDARYGKAKSVEVPLGDDQSLSGEVSERLVNLVANVPADHPTVQRVASYFEDLNTGRVQIISTPN